LKKIGHVSPYLFENYLIISLDMKWIEICNGIPKFTVMIDNSDRLILLGPIISLDKEVIEKMKNYEEKPEDALQRAVNIISKCQRCSRFFSEPDFR